jgi:hypothetical protein
VILRLNATNHLFHLENLQFFDSIFETLDNNFVLSIFIILLHFKALLNNKLYENELKVRIPKST